AWRPESVPPAPASRPNRVRPSPRSALHTPHWVRVRCACALRKLPCSAYVRPLTTEDRVTLDEAKAALQRGRHLVLVLPPDVEQAAAVWELVSAPAVIVCADHGSAAEWAAAAPAGMRVHAVTGLSRATHILKERAVPLLAGAVQDLAALV